MSDFWDSYIDRTTVCGGSYREAVANRAVRFLLSNLPKSLSYETLTMDGEECRMAVINSDNLQEKKILSLPGEHIRLGSIVCWGDNHWLVTQKDAECRLYDRAIMIQCNFLLKWIDSRGDLHERWCVVEDGTKYLVGESTNKTFAITIPNMRVAITLPKDEDTQRFGRETRLIIDDALADGVGEHRAVFTLTKPLKVGSHYNGEGVYRFIMQETPSTKYDNLELGVADYYRHFPFPLGRSTAGNDTAKPIINPDVNTDKNGKGVWL